MASTFTNAIGDDGGDDDVVVVAEIVWRHGGDLDDAFAVVTQPQHTRFLQKHWRIVGVNGSESGGATTTTTMTAAGARNSTASADGDATAGGTHGDLAGDAALRLRLEEMYVGLYHGFLTLKQPPGDEDGQEDVDAFCHELVALGQSDRRHQLALSAMQRLRLRVFRDLWEKGYFVAFGSKFSADFLIYEDVPSRSHATALVIVKEYDVPFDSLDIVSHCRVAKMVKKQVFFASQHTEQRDEVVYIAVNHALLAARQEL